jgi:hypothetical protein
MLRAHIDAGRLQAYVNPVRTVVALGSRVRVRVNVEGIIWAGLHTRLTADAPVIIEIHDSILARIEGLHGANLHAGRIRTVVTPEHGEDPPRIGKYALLRLFHPGPVYANGDIVFSFAGYRAGMAADALAVVNNESVLHPVPRLF